MLKLRRVATLDVAKGWVGVYHSLVAEVLQGHGIARGARALQPTLAEGERAEVLVYQVEQLFR